MLLGFCVFSEAGTAAILLYIATYCFAVAAAVPRRVPHRIAIAEQNGGDETIEAFRGLGTRAPVLAACMAVFLFSLTGLPPFAGFIGKFYIFASLLRAGGSWYWFVAIVGVLNSVVSLFYYARVLRAMFLSPAEQPAGIDVRPMFGATTVALALPTIVLGIYWGPVYDFVPIAHHGHW
jgi:NADH-quinone oxidoreductase subunit N